MSQGNLDNRIKEAFESMDEFDQKEALKRKEDVWQRSQSKKDTIRGRQWLLILLLGALFFAAGWLLKHTQNIETNPQKPQDKIQSTQTNQFANEIEKKKQIMIKQELDSVIKVNRILSAELAAMNDKFKTIHAPESTNHISYIRDTIYVTEVKIQEQIVERIIKDTILIEVPVEQDIHPVIAKADVNESKKNDQVASTTNPTERPSSVQFNFSEANLKDK